MSSSAAFSCNSFASNKSFFTPSRLEAQSRCTAQKKFLYQANRRRKSPPTSPRMLFGDLYRAFTAAPIEYDFEAIAASGTPAVHVENLRKTFKRQTKSGGKKTETLITAVDGVSFSVNRGEIFGLLGPNSSGKTTTLRCLSTLCAPDSGTINFYGCDVVTTPHHARGMIGFVAQNAGLDKVLTGREHLELFAGLAHLNKSDTADAIEEAIEVLALGDYIDRLTAVYSGGIIRRLDLAICLLNRPPILILDEPTVGLDVESRSMIWRVLKRLRDSGTAVVFTSHYLEEVDLLSDRVAIMEQGVVLAAGTPSELKDALGGDRVSIRLAEFTDFSDAQRAANALRTRGLAREAIVNTLRMNTIELVVDPGHAAVGTDIVNALRDLGHDRLFSFAQSKPSLDDVYLASTGRSIADADSAAKDKRDAKSMRKELMK